MFEDDETLSLPYSLVELSYYACNDLEQRRYNQRKVKKAELQICCKSLIRIVQLNSDVSRFQPLGDRRNMYEKVKPIIVSQCSRDYIVEDICEKAASYAHIHCMKFARAIGVPWFSPPTDHFLTACDMAARSGSLECLIYAHTRGSRWTATTCSIAASGGHLDCLTFLHENGCSWDSLTCTLAAQNGRIECLAYARRNGCPWDAYTCSEAAKKGQLECFKYCRENGCPWDDKTCKSAFLSGKLECLYYALDNGCPYNSLESLIDILPNPLASNFQNRNNRNIRFPRIPLSDADINLVRTRLRQQEEERN